MQGTEVVRGWPRIAVKLALIFGLFLAALGVSGASAEGQDVPADEASRVGGDCAPHYVGAFGASATDSQNEGFANQTIRMTSYMHEGGYAVRLRLSNLFGDQPVTFDAVFVGSQREQNVADGSPEVDEGTNRRVTFNGGKNKVTLQPGAQIKSDPVNMRVGALQHLATSIYVAEPTGPATEHGLLLDEHTSFVAPGNRAGAESGTGFVANEDLAYYFLTDIEVRKANDAATIVAFGDSITDGFNSTPNEDQSYPDHLARRLQTNERYATLSVSNQGISGNRILRNDRGPRALSRLDRDVLSQPGVTDVIFLEGINDIAGVVDFFSEPDPTDPPAVERASAKEIIEGMKTIIARAHAAGLRIHGGTLLPSGDLNDATPSPVPFSPTYSDEQANREREKVNEWIRNRGEFDSVVDFDKALRDPRDREEMQDRYNSGDNLHPNDAGYKRMAQEVDLTLFKNSSVCPRR